jgi:cytochrome P450
MSEEAVLIVGAGTNTTSWALSVACFHLLSQPTILRKLKDELEAVDPERDGHIALVDLERLPYLTGVCKEGLRLSYGATGRIPRIAPDVTMTCQSWKIPPGTPVCMDIYSTHHNEDVYPDSYAFKPERWTGKDAAALDKYFVAFSKGPRMCLGMTLAWAEMYLALAGVWRRFGSLEAKGKDDVGTLELFKTDESDVKLARDFVFAAGKDGSLGVRVKVSR